MDMDPAVETFEEKLAGLIRPICEGNGFELVAVQFRREQHGQVLRVVIYHPDGITVDDCAKISRETSYLMDVEDLVDQAYHLEVSSPGLDWSLKNRRDFERCNDRKVKITWVDEQGTETIEGTIKAVDDDVVTITDGKKEYEIPLLSIKKAKLVIEF